MNLTLDFLAIYTISHTHSNTHPDDLTSNLNDRLL